MHAGYSEDIKNHRISSVYFKFGSLKPSILCFCEALNAKFVVGRMRIWIRVLFISVSVWYTVKEEGESGRQ